MLNSKFWLVAPLLLMSQGTAQNQNVQILDVKVAPLRSLGDPTHYQATVIAPLPAAFPRPASKVELEFTCLNGLNFSSGTSESEAKAFLAYAKPTYTTKVPFEGGVGNVKFSCTGGKMTVSSPQLAKLWTTPCPPKTACDAAKASTNVSRQLAYSANSQTLSWSIGWDGFDLSLSGGKLRVTKGTADAAVSMTQNGKTVPLWVSGAPAKSVPYDVKKPFTLSMTANQGELWNNVTIAPGRNTMTFWQSAGKAAGDPPPVQ